MNEKLITAESALGLIFLPFRYDKMKERMRVEVVTMKTKFYKLRRNRVISGVLSGLADKFNFDLGLLRFLFIIFTVFNFGLGILIYILLAVVMPYKEDVEAEMYGTGPRKMKDAEPINDNDGWFW
ncbi:phage-shock protein [Streptococcus cristatus]|uniref:Phage-shock protein n=3 Tax=Streptococcus cristatus TaxID=45634 RepID=A0A512ACJ5_STRCR|nr:phage-shock protein [Streptococcus cristatus]